MRQRAWGRCGTGLILLALAACGDSHRPISEEQERPTPDAGGPGDGDAGQQTTSPPAGGAGTGGGPSSAGSGGSDGPAPPVPGVNDVCERGGACIPLSAGVDKLDLLLSVDNSGSMAEEQAALRNALPKLMRVLASGDREDGGSGLDFAPVQSMHLGVVSSDLGLVGISGIDLCMDLGDEGRLLNAATTDPAVTGCNAQGYPKFLTFAPDSDDPAQTATDLACISTLGTDGCGFEQQLESTLKALWPADDTRIVFLPNPATMFGEFGQGGDVGTGGENAGFLRSDPLEGLSLVAIVMLTDEEDCSSQNLGHLRPPQFLNPAVPADQVLAQQGLNVRCHFNPENLFRTVRYVEGLKQLRAGNEDLVVFGAIAGVPPDAAVIPEGFETDAAVRAKFYETIRTHPRMQPMVDTKETPDPQDDTMVPSCDTPMGRAFAPHRIVEVAEGLGANGVVQSICNEDLGPAFDAILDRIVPKLGAQCLPRPLSRSGELVAGCDVLWALPHPSRALGGAPAACSDRPYLTDTGRTTADGSALCRVAQLGVRDAASSPQVVPTESQEEGWYYDDFSAETQMQCPAGSQARVAYTANALLLPGVRAYLDCGG